MIEALAGLSLLAADPVAEIEATVRARLAYRREAEDVWLGRDDAYAQGYGDCDEFAIAAATEALERGVDPRRMRFVLAVSRWSARDQHMWLEIDGRRVADTSPGDQWLPDLAFPVPADLPRRGDLKPLLLAILRAEARTP